MRSRQLRGNELLHSRKSRKEEIYTQSVKALAMIVLISKYVFQHCDACTFQTDTKEKRVVTPEQIQRISSKSKGYIPQQQRVGADESHT